MTELKCMRVSDPTHAAAMCLMTCYTQNLSLWTAPLSRNTQDEGQEDVQQIIVLLLHIQPKSKHISQISVRGKKKKKKSVIAAGVSVSHRADSRCEA